MPQFPDPGPIAIVGAGGFGRECLDIIEALNTAGARLTFLGFMDDGEVDDALLKSRNTALLGPIRDLTKHTTRAVVAIGHGSARSSIDKNLFGDEVEWAVLIHPQATLGSECTVGPGTVLNAGARVTTNARLGRHVQVHTNAAVGHDAILDDYVSVFPGATVSGSVILETGVTVGTGANVLPGIRVGSSSFVGAGAVVTRDVPAGVTVVGAPARMMSSTDGR